MSWCAWAARVALVGASVTTLFLFTRLLEPREDVSFYALEGGEVIALKSLQNGKYLEVHHGDGKVYATASDSHGYAAQWRVLVLDAATVEVLAKSAQAVDYHSQRFTGRKMSSGSGCACSGFSNDHGFGRFCHPWETDDQEAWCYVNSSCASDSARGSFGKRYEACSLPNAYTDSGHFGPDEQLNESSLFDQYGRPTGVGELRLMPASGCNCSGYQNSHGFGASCKGWEFEGQNPWCYVEPSCKGQNLGGGGGSSNGSFGQPYDDCYEAWPGQTFGNTEYTESVLNTDSVGRLLPSPSPPPPPRSGSSSALPGDQASGFQPLQPLAPRSGCACSGYKNAHGFGATCGGWEYAGQTPWCYVAPECHAAKGGGGANHPGSFGQPYEDCEEASDGSNAAGGVNAAGDAAKLRRRARARRRLLAPARLTQMLASASSERLLVLINRESRAFLQVQPPPHKDALQLTARADALSIRAVFSSFERTHMLLSFATNSLLNLCDETGGGVCTGARRAPGAPLKLLRQPRHTARWALEVVPPYYSQPRAPAAAGA